MSESRTILVFDTDEASRERIVESLRLAGHGVVATGDGSDALDLAEDCRVDLAVVQWGAPELDGLEIACRVKEQGGYVPVIWLGEPQGIDAVRGFVRNTDGYLSRPVLLGDFEPLVRRLLESRREQEERLAASRPRLSAIDTLTGLPLHSGLLGQLQADLEAAESQGSSVGLLLVDVDDFRRVNDEVGFDNANAVLREVADRVRLGLRSVDTLFRLGGDELAAVLPFTDDVGAVIAAERLREEVQVHTFGVADSEGGEAAAHVIRLTVSIGVAASTLLGYDAGALLQLADEALAAAKTKTNRVVLGGH